MTAVFLSSLPIGCSRAAPQGETRNSEFREPLARKGARAAARDSEDPESYTNTVVHNVIFHTSDRLQMKVKWMRAKIYPTSPAEPASLDDTHSYRLEVIEGLVGMNVSAFSSLLKSGAFKEAAIRNLKIEPAGQQLKISGTLRKFVPLPVEMIADVSATPDHRKMRLRATKIRVLKLPFKRLLGALRLHAADFIGPGTKGITANGDVIDVDINRLLPAPSLTGPLNEVRVWKTGELMLYYGEPREDAVEVRQWRNFMRMRGGTLNFGKITMHNTDLLLVDTSQADWLNFDVQNYQEQLVNGETHMTPSAGLQIFIPDSNRIPASKRNRDISVQWMKNRNSTPVEGQ